MSDGLREKAVLVTGGSRGIGRATALRFANENARVAICYRADQAGADATVASARSQAADCLAIQCDVRRPDEVASMVGQILDRWGRIDVLVNNACAPFTGVRIPFPDISMATWQEMVDTGLTGAFLCSQQCVPPMKQQGGGRIVNVSSGWGIRGGPLLAHYCATKAGLIGLTTALAAEVGPDNILVNAVAPGLVRTETVQAMPEGYTKYYVEHNPLRRLVEMDDVAEAIFYLASDANQNVHGHVLTLTGGMA